MNRTHVTTTGTGDAVLHIDRVDEGTPEWRFECVHPIGAAAWRYRNPDGSFTEADGCECWFESWWSALGAELIGWSIQSNTTLPVPVRPSVDWDFDNGGTVVLA